MRYVWASGRRCGAGSRDNVRERHHRRDRDPVTDGACLPTVASKDGEPMKLISFQRNDHSQGIGIVTDGDEIVDLNRLDDRLPSDMSEFLATGETGLNSVRDALQSAGPESALLREGTFSYLPVVPRPSKMFLIGLNYASHAEELNVGIPKWPSIFGRFVHTLVGHNQPVLVPKSSDAVDWEGELAIVIGKAGKYITEDEAMSHVAGYACFNDISIRDYQERLPRITLAKNFDASGPLGPWLVTADEIADPNDLQLRTTVNGEVKQECSTSDFIFSIPFLISHISSACRLVPGDIISTGTPAGVGWTAEPQTYLKHGDTVSVSISGVGELVNMVVDED